MGMPEIARRWTRRQVLDLPDDGNRYELIIGELVVTPSPGPRHQIVLARLYDHLQPYLAKTGVGMVLWSPADLRLGEEEVLQPDLFAFRAVPGGAPASWEEITSLLLAVEALSPTTAQYDRRAKRHRYQRARVPEYWIVDLDGRVVERWRPGDERPEILTAQLEWRPFEELEPLVVDLESVFA